MKTQFYNKRQIFRAKYSQNMVMQLIIACAVFYILLKGINVIFIVLSDHPKTVIANQILPNVGLQSFEVFIHKPWILLTYFWIHDSLLYMLSNMLWLYCFGSVIQSFVGYKEIFPMFILSCLFSGLCFVGLSAFWPALQDDIPLLSALPGVMAFAIGAIVLVPRYRYYLTERFSISIWVVLIVFLLLNVLTVTNRITLLVLLVLSALSGALYIQLLKNGIKPGLFFYRIGNNIQASMTPPNDKTNKNAIKRKQILKISKHQVQEHPSQEYIDILLDKINQKGYSSLTSEEKDTLMNAGK